MEETPRLWWQCSVAKTLPVVTRTERVMPICNTHNEFAIVWILNLMWPLCPSTKATDKVGWRDVLAASTATYCDVQHRFNRDE